MGKKHNKCGKKGKNLSFKKVCKLLEFFITIVTLYEKLSHIFTWRWRPFGRHLLYHSGSTSGAFGI